jgi:hypothetical protein
MVLASSQPARHRIRLAGMTSNGLPLSVSVHRDLDVDLASVPAHESGSELSA